MVFMLFSEIGPDTLNRELNSYLQGSKLSLSQIAKRLGVSKGHLSEIKNGKAQPALNTGLRILKMCGLEVEQRKAWAHFYNTSISDEYLEVHGDWVKENSRKLSEKVSFLLARDLDLMNAYVDIVGEENKGIPLVDLRCEYGRSIEKKLQKLVDQNVIEVDITDLGKVYRAGKVDPIMTKNASYDLARSVLDDQQLQYQSGEHKGKFKFHINDVDQEGVQKLTELLDKTIAEAEKIMLDHKQTRPQGGERFIFELFLGKLKSFIICTLLGLGLFFSSQNNTYAQGGGLSGGNANIDLEKFVQSKNWVDLFKENELKINWPQVLMGGEYVEINNICHFIEDDKIRTVEPINTCVHYELREKICWMVIDEETNLSKENCRFLPRTYNMGDYSEYLQKPMSSVLSYRHCVKEELRSHELNLRTSGVFVRFNDPSTGDPSLHKTFDNRSDEGTFHFDVEIYIDRLVDGENFPQFISTKDYQIPVCL
jgi:transcriptional regulator with XRE-family HTH domain